MVAAFVCTQPFRCRPEVLPLPIHSKTVVYASAFSRGLPLVPCHSNGKHQRYCALCAWVCELLSWLPLAHLGRAAIGAGMGLLTVPAPRYPGALSRKGGDAGLLPAAQTRRGTVAAAPPPACERARSASPRHLPRRAARAGAARARCSTQPQNVTRWDHAARASRASREGPALIRQPYAKRPGRERAGARQPASGQ